jgi:hypothetical protein
MAGCASLGLEGLQLSSAGVDGALNSGGNRDNSCGCCFNNWDDWFSNRDDCFDSWDNSFDNWDDRFGNDSWCLSGNGNYILRGCPGGCQKANNKELKEIKAKADYTFLYKK